MIDSDLKYLASALIIMGALSSCGEDIQNVEYDIQDRKINIPTPKLSNREQCYGIALAQFNDCASRGGNCAGTAKLDKQSDKWKYVTRGSCAKKGGALTPTKDPRVR